MIEIGQPMHAFDSDKINGKLSVRFGKKNETFHALDGQKYLLNNNIPVVSELHPATKIEPFWSSIINGVQFENIAAECKRLSNDESIRKQSSEFAFNKFQEKSQLVFTKELIKEIS